MQLLPRPSKIAIMVAHDGAMSAAALFGALWLRYSGAIPQWVISLPVLMVCFGLLSVVLLGFFGLYRGIWRYTSTNELVRIGEAVALNFLIAFALLTLATRLQGFPRSGLIIACFIQITLVAGPRFLYRLLRERRLFERTRPPAIKKVLLVGVGDNAEMFIREVSRNPALPYRIMGILDDKGRHQGRRIHTVPVLGPARALTQVLEKLKSQGKDIDLLVLTSAEQVSNVPLMNAARTHNLVVRRLPEMEDLDSGERVSNLKPVALEDLLGRPPIKLDNDAVAALVKDKVVLVTGAGGSIGSELCRQVAANGAQKLIQLDMSEYALYEADMDMAALYPDLARECVLADVKDAQLMGAVMGRIRPQVVLHAAAYKHVPMVEANPIVGVENNMYGTMTVADTAARSGVEKMVVISTDKAVNPTNVMGATKRAAEICCQNHPGPTKFVTVRFGNVLGSSGSVVPLFKKQIEAGGPVTVTDKRMTRYFMTIPEAVQLVLQAASHGQGGEIFVLDMGEPVNIWEMAEAMIRLSGLVPGQDVEVVEVGMRPGEKLYEELLHQREALSPTGLTDVLLAAARKMPAPELEKHILAIQNACNSGNCDHAVAALRAFVPEYTPAENSPYCLKKAAKA